MQHRLGRRGSGAGCLDFAAIQHFHRADPDPRSGVCAGLRMRGKMAVCPIQQPRSHHQTVWTSEPLSNGHDIDGLTAKNALLRLPQAR